MTTVWTVYVDWDRNGGFTNEFDDVTERVISANWFLGFRSRYADVADDSMLDLVLDNSDRRFSPEYTDSPLYGKLLPLRPVQIRSATQVVDVNGNRVVDALGNPVVEQRTHWTGWISRIEMAVGKSGQRTATIVAAGPMMLYAAADTSIAVQRNQRADQIIAQLIQQVIVPPALNGAWILGRVGSSELDSSTWLADTVGYSDLDEGISTFAYVADNWVQRGGSSASTNDTFNVYHAIQDVTAAERGHFFFDREGKAIFWNRHHLFYDVPVQVTFDDTMTGLTYAFGGVDDLKNDIFVTCHPRALGPSANDILWSLDDNVTIPKPKMANDPDATKQIIARYDDGSGNRIGALDVTLTDVAFKKGNASVTLEAGATSATITITNTSSKSVELKSCNVRGQKLTDFGTMQARSTDIGSILDYGRRTMSLNLPALDKFDEAQGVADFERLRRSQPRGTVSSLTLASHGTDSSDLTSTLHVAHENQVGLTLGDRIEIKEAQSYHGKSGDVAVNASYFIVGEAHKLSAGATLLETTWYLEPTPAVYPWRLGVVGYSELGGMVGDDIVGTTVVAY